MVAHEDRRRARFAQGVDDAAPDRVVADEGEGADGDGAAKLVAHHGQDAGDLFAARGPCGGVGGVRVHDTAHLAHVTIDVGMCGGVRGRRSLPQHKVSVEVTHDHRLGTQVVVGDARGFDDEKVLAAVLCRAAHALGNISGRPDDESPPGQLGMQGGDVFTSALDLARELGGPCAGVSVIHSYSSLSIDERLG